MDVTTNGAARRRIGYGSPTTEFNPNAAASFSTPCSPVATPLIDDDQEVAFFGPRAWGERNITLTHYWHSRVAKAAVAFVVVHCILLIVHRLLAVTLFVSGNLFWAVPYCLAIGIAAILHSTIYLRDYIKAPVIVDTRFAAFLDLFSFRGTTEFLKFSSGSILIAWAFAAQLGTCYQGPILFTTDLTRNSLTKFLNEEIFYIILAGAYTGTLLFLQRHFDISRPYMKLPIVHRLKFLEFKAKARPTLMKSFRKSFWIAISFTCVYHFFLYDVKNTIIRYSLFLDSSTLEIARTWYEFFNLRRFLVMYLSCGLTVFSFRMSNIFMKMFMMAPQDFDVELYHEEQAELSLSEAMVDTRVPLIRVLAFQYLLKISEGRDAVSKDRRRKIFSLIPPSDVAAEWQAVKRDCLAVIDKFSVALDCFRVVADLRTAESAVPVISRHLAMQWMRLEAQRSQTNQKLRAMNTFERLSYKFRSFIHRMPWLLFVFNNEAEIGFCRLVRNCQEMLIACRALSNLVAASIHEDRYGVVQRDIPQILNAFATLENRLSAFSKASPLCKGYAISVHRSLVRVWLAFPDSFGSEALKHFV